MRIQLWNILAGGGPRISRIVASIAKHQSETVVLCETTRQRFVELRAGLGTLGFRYFHGECPTGSERGVLVASKVECEPAVASAKSAPPTRWVEVYFPRKKFILGGTYLPDQPKTIAAFWPHLHEAASALRAEHFLLLGDLNSGHGPLDAEGAEIAGDAGFSAMPHFGMFDLWRHKNRTAREYTWYGKSGNRRSGFRIDHALGTLAMRKRVRDVRYSHEERENGVSDHSSLLLAVR